MARPPPFTAAVESPREPSAVPPPPGTFGPGLAETASTERTDFFHLGDGLTYTSADRYTDGATAPNNLRNVIRHIVIAFNKHDARKLQKLKIAPGNAAAPDETRCRSQSSIIELSDESANLEHSPDGDGVQSRGEELAAATGRRLDTGGLTPWPPAR
jgi:hypothetical protein